jgi:small subunit ribosomal protein S13
MAEKEIRGIVRFAEVDLDGNKKISAALMRVKGIGHALARALPVAAGLDPNIRIGSLDDTQIKKLEAVLANPTKFGIPAHQLNRQSDPETGLNRHLVSSELSFARKADVALMRKIRCYRGIRHELGLPVRGQRTRSSFRTGAAAGVMRKAVAKVAKQAKAAPAPALAKVPEIAGEKPGTPKPAEKPEAK